MDLDEVKLLSKTHIEEFLGYNRGGNQLVSQFRIMNLGEIAKNEIYNEPSKSQHYHLFINIKNLGELERKKGTWFTSGYIERIWNLMIKYPDYHQTIIKTLKISKASYYRLMHRSNIRETRETDQRRIKREAKALNKIEEQLLETIVTPPTYPLTLNEI